MDLERISGYTQPILVTALKLWEHLIYENTKFNKFIMYLRCFLVNCFVRFRSTGKMKWNEVKWQLDEAELSKLQEVQYKFNVVEKSK